MAIYHFSASVIGRSSGRSATAAAAYRSGGVIPDERTGETHDYSRKSGVEGTLILAPDAAPDWAQDRAALWNAVEVAEVRKDAQVAREITVALPAELSAAERRALVEDWARTELVGRGMVADVAFHEPHREGDQRNHHAHILLPTRSIGPEGFGPKVREWNSKDQLAGWRESWAEAQNRALERAEVQERVDHRSLVAQGRGDLPTRHLGPAATALERQEEREAAQAGREAEPITEAGRWNAFARECNDTLDRARELARGAREAWGGFVRQAGDLAHQLGDLMRSSGGMEALAQGLRERSPEGRAELWRQQRETQAEAQAREERLRAERSAQERGGGGRERGRDDDWSR
ncbi:MAG: MobQ family relaxase [Candidatus Microsaccharimonas sp.]